ncbi:MAG: hypothetical protein CMJ51_04775 [Planctomycetaceae bacterium]|nr:hypothetical protein [Planctomycetaceae bacterium]
MGRVKTTRVPVEDAGPGTVLAILIAGLAAIRLMLPFAPDRLFDVDPGSVGGPLPAVGSAGSLLIDALLIVCAGFALGMEARRGRADRALLALLLLPLPVIAWHGWNDTLDAWRGIDWFAAVAAGVALAHLVRVPSTRRAVLAILLAAIAANAVRGVHQVSIEHADTVAFYEENRDMVLASRGWAPDSPAALIYERRLRQPEATGWIGFSNVLSGLLAAGGVLAIGLLVEARRSGASDRRGAGGPVMLGFAGIACLLLVGLNGSKGAIAASGVGVFGLLLVLGPLRTGFLRRSGWWLVAVAFLAFSAILLRGLLPEEFGGDRSLLFRWHYLQGAVSMFLAHPWIGVGPDGFQDAYLAARPLRSPEAVASAHSVFTDWIAALGVTGVAWILVAGRIVLRRGGDSSEASAEVEDSSGSRLLITGGLILVVILVLQFWIEGPLGSEAIAVRIASITAAGLVGIAVWSVSSTVPDSIVRGIAVAAAGVVVAQSQIEMLAWQPGSLVACWGFLACAGGVSPPRSSKGTGVEGGIIVVIFMIIAVLVGLASLRDEVGISQARRSIAGLHRTPGLDLPPPSAGNRRDAADSLAVDLIPGGDWTDPRRVRGVINLYMSTGVGRDRRAAAKIAAAWCDARPGVASASAQASVLEAIAIASAKQEDDRRAEAAIRTAIEWDPFDAGWRLRLAERLAALGRCREAIAAIDDAVALDATQELDPLARFGEAQLRRVEAVRSACESSSR